MADQTKQPWPRWQASHQQRSSPFRRQESSANDLVVAVNITGAPSVSIPCMFPLDDVVLTDRSCSSEDAEVLIVYGRLSVRPWLACITCRDMLCFWSADSSDHCSGASELCYSELADSTACYGHSDRGAYLQHIAISQIAYCGRHCDHCSRVRLLRFCCRTLVSGTSVNASGLFAADCTFQGHGTQERLFGVDHILLKRLVQCRRCMPRWHKRANWRSYRR
jgi:hypothetical protein